MATDGRIVHQPLHSSLVDRLDPRYRQFHEEVVQYIPKIEEQPWDAKKARSGPVVPGGAELEAFERTKDWTIDDGKIGMRGWWPKGEKPSAGWPLMIWFHGGGWVLGNLNTENSVCTAFTNRLKCVTISVNYRHAPEDVFPAAVDDVSTAMNWVVANGSAELDVDTSKIALGGNSAGANLAAVLSLIAPTLSPPIPIASLFMSVPCVDNSLTASSPGYAANPHAPWLPPAKIAWYKKHYLPNESDWKDWRASPIYASDEALSKLPPCFVGVAELDVLAQEGRDWSEKLKSLGVAVEFKEYKRVGHEILRLDGILDASKQLVSDGVRAVGRGFADK